MAFDLATKADEASEFLRYFDYPTNTNVIESRIFKTWFDNKSTIRGILRNHPKWDDDQQAIIFDADIETGINSSAIHEFVRWFSSNLHDEFFKRNSVPEVFDMPVKEFFQKCRLYADLSDVMERIIYSSWLETSKLRYGNLTFADVRRLNNEYSSKRRQLEDDYHYDGDYLIPLPALMRWRKIDLFLDDLVNICSPNATSEFAERINALIPEVKAVEGQKISRIISKIGKLYGLDKIVEIHQIYRRVEGGGGRYVDKDYGWNYKFAAFGDAINPIKVHQYTVISINPFDYWTMSFGDNWASCQTIDKGNIRDVSENHYSGCYSAGTESYMLDTSSIIMYTVKPDYEGEMWKADKSRRCMFHLARNGQSFVQGRLYPDSRDGGDLGMAAQFRQIFQRILSECQEDDNYWNTRKGTEAIAEYVESHGHHYRDYAHYEDCSYSVRKGRTPMMIPIGRNAICPNCGCEHGEEETITCSGCSDGIGSFANCAHCDEPISEDDDYIYIDDDHYFCCGECAEREGYRFCVNDEEWHCVDEDDCFRDDYDDEWYYGEPEVETVDGNRYASEDNAYSDGYRYAVDEGEWYSEDDCVYDDYTDEWYYNDEEGIYTSDGNWYHDEETAREAGYCEDEDGNWEREVA